MKIGIDVTASIYSGTGVATYYQSLIPELLRIGSKHEFVLLGYALRQFSQLTLANKKLLIPPRMMELLWNQLHIVPVEYVAGSVDIFHAWDYLQPPSKKAKLVTTVHDLTTLKFPMYHHISIVEAQARRLKWVRKEADLIIADSLATKDDIVELLGVEEERIKVIHLAAGEQYRGFRGQGLAIREEKMRKVKEKYGINGNYFISVGTQEPRKNIKRTVEAFQRFQQLAGRKSLEIRTAIGWGNQWPDVKVEPVTLAIAGRLGWGEQILPTPGVTILGVVPVEDLPALYAGAVALIYPSLYEGFGLPILEAMEVGCPVITSDRGSLREVAGGAAVLVEPEDVESIARGMETALEEREKFIKKGLKQAEKFSWEKAAKETLQAYESVVGH